MMRYYYYHFHIHLGCILFLLLGFYRLGIGQDQDKELEIKTIALKKQEIPPEWALWERHLLAQIYPAALEFVEKYTEPDGTLKWREEWPGMDGSDDGYESFYNFPLYSALGGPMELDSLSRHLWEGITKQFTTYGQVYDEFDAGYDWMHHGESYTFLYLLGLTDPTNETFKQRSLKFAELYIDPKYGNYDVEHKLIRSPLNGSKGPRFINTAEDWVTHRPILANYLLPYEDIPGIDSSLAWNNDDLFPRILKAMNERMMKGDVPLNLASTSLILNAYMYTGDEKYKKWIEDYTATWMKRVEENQGFLPDNVGLSGKVGENMNGKKWGGILWMEVATWSAKSNGGYGYWCWKCLLSEWGKKVLGTSPVGH